MESITIDFDIKDNKVVNVGLSPNGMVFDKIVAVLERALAIAKGFQKSEEEIAKLKKN
jgi:hypothetical protein